MPDHVDMPEPVWTEAILEPEVRVTKGGDAPVAGPLPGRLLLGRPVRVRLTAERARDPALQTFIEGHAGRHDFTLVHLGCTFRPAEDEPFARASLQVRLSRANGSDGGSEPIAWSMWPLRESEVLDDSTTTEIGAEAKVFTAKVQRTVAVKRRDVWLEALGELRSDPGWEFTRTPRIPISGSYRLILVVMSDAGAAFGGQVDVTASVERRLLGLVSYRARPAGFDQVVFSSG